MECTLLKYASSFLRHVNGVHVMSCQPTVILRHVNGVNVVSCQITVKHSRRFYGKIIGNWLSVHLPLFFQAHVNVCRNHPVGYGRIE